jgi:hypothetical protein
LQHYHDRIVNGMLERGYDREFAEAIFAQIQDFGEYGFPESRAASFALLVYASAWLKRHEPAALLCAMLNSQPMGFYSPSQLVQDAKRQGTRARRRRHSKRVGFGARRRRDSSAASDRFNYDNTEQDSRNWPSRLTRSLRAHSAFSITTGKIRDNATPKR